MADKGFNRFPSVFDDYVDPFADDAAASRDVAPTMNDIAVEFDSYITAATTRRYIRTGFAAIDRDLKVRSGIYVLGAMPSLGKSTFVLQLARNAAAAGNDTILFSYEMSRQQLYAKTVASIAAERDNSSISAAQILDGYIDPAIVDARAVLSDYGDRMRVAECDDEFDIDKLCDAVNSFNSDAPPLVIVDYLQLIPPTENMRTRTVKDVIDYNFRKLRRLQRELDLTMIIVSSFNRASYTAPVSFESFKETGGIEYNADVLIGMQLYAVNRIAKSKMTVAAAAAAIAAAKLHTPRVVELRLLKNRFGDSSLAFWFLYTPRVDLFVETSQANAEFVDAST